MILVFACAWVSIPYIQFYANFFVSFRQEIKSIEVLVQDFLTAMSNKDADKAYALMSSESDAQNQLSNIDTQLQGNKYVIFEGFREISLNEVNISQFGTYKYAEVSGDVYYEEGFIGDFTAKVVKEGQEWKIQWLTVNAPAGKFAKVK